MKERAFPFVLADPPSFISHSLASANVTVNSSRMLMQPAELQHAGRLAAAGVSAVDYLLPNASICPAERGS